ncbi:hypothetical protein Droror1_Dr00009022 [Drosera rotundifolia]
MSIPHRHRHLDSTTKAVFAPPITSTSTIATTPSSDLARASFDSNVVIVLLALLCGLICALGLNSILRCALRHRRANPQQAMVARLDTTTGLKKIELRQIRVAVVGAAGEEISGTECPICLTEFVEGEKVRVLPKCNHGFHARCIDKWLATHPSCPNCRHSLIDSPVGSVDVCAVTGAPAAGDTASVVVHVES